MLIPRTHLLTLIQNNDLLGAALHLGTIQDPNFSPTRYESQALQLVDVIRRRNARPYDTLSIVAHTADVLYGSFSMTGKTASYARILDNPEPYFLHTLLDSHKATPLTATLLFRIILLDLGVPPS